MKVERKMFQPTVGIVVLRSLLSALCLLIGMGDMVVRKHACMHTWMDGCIWVHQRSFCIMVKFHCRIEQIDGCNRNTLDYF
jgi:hypothetical protein